MTDHHLLHAENGTFRDDSGGAPLAPRSAAAGPNLEVVVRWAAIRLQGWDVRQARPVFSADRSCRLNRILGYSGQ
jgi:hypothetical protein